ncbi:RNA recognition motif [Carpediemonas membranifera]|uniref:RNA recognition motif n=1 Tax=Carpediemonas membranifera TaxID=201153 RepID=A0A8J6APT3_9EUKA|nr:RNA recognition motif [Carpediemonas membranifera]|eukprot:KAG9390421.1 RNA recognition motif [Carpediemonas membranifera]
MATEEKDIVLESKKGSTVHPAHSHPNTGIVYVGHIPHGFYEHQMRGFFGQFGPILRLRLSRNKSTGKSKHYAFIEFDSKSDAEIVAKTMDKYLLENCLLSVHVMDDEKLDKHIWKGANQVFVRPDTEERSKQINEKVAELEKKKLEKARKQRLAEKKAKLEAISAEFDWDLVYGADKKKAGKPVKAKSKKAHKK